jgi:ADP-ribose pyrophosphatase
VNDRREFEPLGGQSAFEGKLLEVRVERFRYPDGEEVTREIVRHPGAVGVVAHDDLHLWLVRQPRESIGDPDLLEIPAGRLDVPGEPPVAAAKRELAEEIGKSARSWEELGSYYSSPGFTDERVHLFLATDLGDASADVEDNERIEVVPWPLERLEDAIDASQDAKTLIGLLLLLLRRRAGED